MPEARTRFASSSRAPPCGQSRIRRRSRVSTSALHRRRRAEVSTGCAATWPRRRRSGGRLARAARRRHPRRHPDARARDPAPHREERRIHPLRGNPDEVHRGDRQAVEAGADPEVERQAGQQHPRAQLSIPYEDRLRELSVPKLKMFEINAECVTKDAGKVQKSLRLLKNRASESEARGGRERSGRRPAGGSGRRPS